MGASLRRTGRLFIVTWTKSFLHFLNRSRDGGVSDRRFLVRLVEMVNGVVGERCVCGGVALVMVVVIVMVLMVMMLTRRTIIADLLFRTAAALAPRVKRRLSAE